MASVIVIEGEKRTRTSMCDVLSAAGHEVESFATVDDARTALHRRHDVDVIICADAIGGKRVGAEYAVELNITRSTPFVLVSANDWNEFSSKLEQASPEKGKPVAAFVNSLNAAFPMNLPMVIQRLTKAKEAPAAAAGIA